MKVFVACSVLEDEIKKAMQELGLNNNLSYIEAALHVDLKKLENALKATLADMQNKGEKSAVLLGTKCHPNIEEIAADFNAKIINGSNCIELLLGEEEIKRLDQEAKTFYLTGGWLKNWRKIFIEGLKWDAIDARMNFGFYDRLLLLDTGLREFSDEEILEFFEYTQVPVEIYPVTLDHFKEKLWEIAE